MRFKFSPGGSTVYWPTRDGAEEALKSLLDQGTLAKEQKPRVEATRKKGAPRFGITAEFIGEVVRPIDIDLVAPSNRKYEEQYFEEKRAKLLKQRQEKLPLLAKQLGMQADLAGIEADHSMFGIIWRGVAYRDLAITMAMAFGVPGFQEKKRKIPREFVCWLLGSIEWRRAGGDTRSDLDFCLEFVKIQEPEISRPNKADARRRARTWANLIAAQRVRWKRDTHKNRRVPTKRPNFQRLPHVRRQTPAKNCIEGGFTKLGPLIS